jgi:hypothetical protein
MGTTPAKVQNVLRKARLDEVVRKLADGGYALASGRSGLSDAPEASAGQAEPGTPVGP